MHLQGDTIPVSQMPLDGKVAHGHRQAREARHRPAGAALDLRKLHPVQPVLLVCPHAAIRAKQIEPDAAGQAPRRHSRPIKSTTKNDEDLRIQDPGLHRGLHRLRQLRPHLPGQDQGPRVPAPSRTSARRARTQNAEFFEDLPDNIMDGTTIAHVQGQRSSASRCSSSPAPAPAAARRPTSSWSPSSSASA